MGIIDENNNSIYTTEWAIITIKDPCSNTQYDTWERVRAPLTLYINVSILFDKQRIA